MKHFRLAVASVVALAASAAPASAAIIFNVDATFTSGGTLRGTFTTNDAINDLIAVDLQSSANGAFEATRYNDLGTVDNEQLPNTFRITIAGPPGKQLQLRFSPPLNATGGTIGGNSFESQQINGAGNRSINGNVTVRTAAVPEPTTWGLMLAGFGMVGVGLRSRRRGTTVTYA